MIYDLRFAVRSGAGRHILGNTGSARVFRSWSCIYSGAVRQDLPYRLSAGSPRRFPPGAVWFVLVASVVSVVGCGQPQAQAPSPSRPSVTKAGGDVEAAAGVADTFAPAKIDILPLTEFTGPSEGGLNTTLNVYVALRDEFGSALKTPGTLRFELYEYVPRSAALKGQRTAIWPDVDLTRPVENNQRWRDFLRAYEFELDVRADRSKTYVLEATCLCPDGKRLTCEYRLRGAGGDRPADGT
jgi:hypothetical protein